MKLGTKLGLAILVGGLMGVTSAFAASNIAVTKHNLSLATNAVSSDGTQNNAEICIYCHTPHGANTGFDGAPLWNKGSSTVPTAYKVYGGGGAATGETLGKTATGEPSNPSKACLSCHDGVSAINSIVNAPGSGAYVAPGDANNNRAFGTTAAGTAFTMPAGITNIGDAGGAVTDVDLRNDHPISVTYTAGRASLRATGDALTGTWAGGYTTISQLLRNGKVECSSCHDPHEGDNPTFLRKDNAGSALCLGCHNK